MVFMMGQLNNAYKGTGKITIAYKGEKSNDWFTPKALYDSIREEFRITYDPCPYKDGEKMGLFKDWGKRVFVNPPYSHVEEWFNKAMLELKKGNSDIIIFLVFARTGTNWFHEYIWDNKNHRFKEHVYQVRFIRGRLKFGESKNSAPDDSMIIIFKNNKEARE